jgi:UPF0755 protein
MARSGRRTASAGSGGFLSALAFLLVIGVIAAAVAFFAFSSQIERAGPTDADKTFVVARGSSVTSIGRDLEREGLIRNARAFRIAHLLFEREAVLQAGEYEIPAGASTRDILRLMASGDALQHAITFPEGITIAGVMRILEESDVLTGDMPAAPAEGAILPETYHVQRGMTRTALLQQMREAHNEALARVWANRQPNLPIATPEDLVTLASIVERETGVARERPLVAAVIVNRLRRPMRLEMDSTIIYGVCKQFPARCRDGRLVDARGQPRVIRASEIALNTGYNTYRIDGLPPTPIANPGLAAMEATANPAQSEAIFFVADGTGGHVFTNTVAEHNAAVARWRQIEAQRLAEERAN